MTRKRSQKRPFSIESGEAADHGALRDMIWTASKALSPIAPNLRVAVDKNSFYKEQLHRLQTSWPLANADRKFWVDFLEGKFARRRGRLREVESSPGFIDVSGAALAKAAENHSVKSLISWLKQTDDEVPRYAQELIGELFSGTFVCSVGHPKEVTVETVRTIGQIFDIEREKHTSNEVAAEVVGERLKMDGRTVLTHVSDWKRWRAMSDFVGQGIKGKSG